MIVLDTNQVIGLGVEQGAKLTLLRRVAQMAGHPLAIPEMVLKEYLGSYRREVADACEILAAEPEAVSTRQREKARKKLITLVPWWLGRPEFIRDEPQANRPIVKSALRHRDKLVQAIFRRIIETPTGADKEGLRREIDRQPPATASGGAGKGARDTVIWLSTLAEAQRVKPFNVYFVTNDRGFGGTELHRELVDEARHVPNLVYVDDIDRLLDRLTCPAEPPSADHDFIRSEVAEDAIRRRLSDGNFMKVELAQWLPEVNGVLVLVGMDLVPPEQPAEKCARRLGETILVASQGVWDVRCRFVVAPPGDSHVDTRQEEQVEISIQLALLATFVDGELDSATVTSHGGICPGRLQAA